MCGAYTVSRYESGLTVFYIFALDWEFMVWKEKIILNYDECLRLEKKRNILPIEY